MSLRDLENVYANASDNQTDTELARNPWLRATYRLSLTYRSSPVGHTWRLWFRREVDRDRFERVFTAVGYSDFVRSIHE